MGTQCFNNFFASGIYLLMGISAGYIFYVGLANGIASGYHYPIQQKLLIGAALTGAAMLVLSAILVHLRPAVAYGIATLATLLVWLAFLPLLAPISQEVIIIIHGTFLSSSFVDLFALSLLPVTTAFSVQRLLKFVRG